MCVCVCVCVCERNVVNATLSQRYLESTFLCCDNVVITMLLQPKSNVVTTLSQRDIVCWVSAGPHRDNKKLFLLGMSFMPYPLM